MEKLTYKIETSTLQKQKPKESISKNIAVTAIMSALLILGKLSLSLIPNVEVVTPLIILFTCAFGFRRTILAVLTFCLFDNFIYGVFITVTVQYFFHFPLLCVTTALLARRWNGQVWIFTLLTAVMSLFFWIETPLIGVVMNFYTRFMPYLISGIPFMIPHMVSTTVFVLLSYPLLYKLLKRTSDTMFAN